MRCPNCSFQNPPGSDECKICGYELTDSANPVSTEETEETSPSIDPSTRKQSSNKSQKHVLEEDEMLDKTFDELFGSTSLKHGHLDPRFEEYASMSDEDEDDEDDYDSDVDSLDDVDHVTQGKTSDNWLDGLQEDIEAVENEFDTLRFGRPNKDTTPAAFKEELEPSNQPIAESIEEPIAESIEEPMDESMDEPMDEFSSQPMDDPSSEYEDDGIIHLSINVKEGIESDDPETLDEDESQVAKRPQKHYTNPNAMRNRAIVITIAIILLLAFLFKLLTPGGEEPVDLTDDQTSSEQTDTTDLTDTTTYSQDIADQTGLFFNQLQAYVNNGNIAVLSMFVDSQDALEQLSTFKKQGTLDEFEISIPEIEVSNTSATENPTADLIIEASLLRTISGDQVTRSSNWKFEWVMLDDTWRISTLTIDSESIVIDDTTNSDNNTSNTGTTTNTDTSTPDTVATRPEGFISTGSFTGGIVTDGQDVSQIRFGKHETFERLVFDLSVWNGTTPTERVAEACHYVATISNDGKTLTLELSGTRGASASAPELTNSLYFESVAAQFPEDDSAVTFVIQLTEKSDFKVFTLSDPGKIIVDVAPHEN